MSDEENDPQDRDLLEGALTVAQLIEQLSELPPDAYVIMSKDAEGNDFSPFAEMSAGLYEPDTTWYGEFISTEDLTWEDKPNAVTLWPVN